MALTPAGQRLYTFVRPFLEHLPGIVRSLREGDYGKPHKPEALRVLEHEGLTYHLCGSETPDGCDATAMWENCGEFLRADAYRQWRLLGQL